eukprot:TRINITY_DN7741_c0_g1_i1.p1 TRINITY_DN7741_c0_g1~~TRINITY_DN7741_c0_g1_i1.p1  ORF type:complete len:686 (+),score=119.64 TRINITY_DN7741_c0_g1_i1:69-2126(+)
MSAPLHPRVDERVMEQFVREGYCVLPNVVPLPLIHAALRAINAEIGRGVMSPEEAEGFVDGVCFKELSHQPVIRNLLLQSDGIHIIRAMLGECHPVWGGQIALRFPGIGCADKVTFTPNPWWNRGWHIDGLSTKKYHHPGTIHNFTALVGVILQDIPDQMSGNLGVFPGGHHMMQEHVQKNGFSKMLLDEQKGVERLPQDLPLPPVHQVVGKAGDMVICHYMLPHTVLPNTSPNIRYAIYFRIHAYDHTPGTFRPEAMLDAWLDWKGLKSVVATTSTRPASQPWSCRFCTLDNIASAQICAACENPRDKTKQFDQPTVPRAGADYSQPLMSPRSVSTRGITYTNSNPAIDREVATLHQLGEKHFEDKDWRACQPIYGRLATLRPEDPIYTLRAGEVHTWPHQPQMLPVGEAYLRRAIQMLPMPAAYSALATNLNAQGKKQEIPDLAKAVAAMPMNEEEGMKQWQITCVRNCAELAVKSLMESGKTQRECKLFLDQLKSASPDAELGQDLESQLEVMELTKQADDAVQREPKNYLKGQKLYGRLCELKPKDYRVHLMAAVCYTYSIKNNAELAEEYLRKGFEISPVEPLGHALMCRILCNRKKHSNCIEELGVLLDMVTPERGYELGDAHPDLLIDCMRAVRESIGHLHQGNLASYEPLSDRFKRTFPPLRFRVDSLKYEQPCSIM